MQRQEPDLQNLPKSPTGILGLDDLTGGGLPRGRPTLLCGGAGSGKTLFGVLFLVNGALNFGEPGVFLSFDETAEDLAKNVRSLGYDLDQLSADKKLSVDFVQVVRSEIEEMGDYDLDGLFIRLGQAIDSIGAKRVVLDSLESLFTSLTNTTILRAELTRLFRWLKDRGVTAVVTAERGVETLTRHGIEEYVSDCVIVLDHRVRDQIATRLLRVAKYRGSFHGTNEYPFLIGERGIDVQPVTSVKLDHPTSNERVSSGVKRIDDMMGGEGFFRGSSVLISGAAGAGKSSLAAVMADAACRRGERAIYFAFEEPQSQIIRNMRSIGTDLEPHVQAGLLQFHAARTSTHGLEMHRARMSKAVREFQPHVVIVDPVTNFIAVGTSGAVYSMIMRLVDELKSKLITTVFTDLIHTSLAADLPDGGLSSLVDTWLSLNDNEVDGERNRVLYLLKSRGMAHSNQVREFLITSRGIDLVDVYLGPDGVLTGSARLAREGKERADTASREQAFQRNQRAFEAKRLAVTAQIAVLTASLETDEGIQALSVLDETDRLKQVGQERTSMASSRDEGTMPGRGGSHD